MGDGHRIHSAWGNVHRCGPCAPPSFWQQAWDGSFCVLSQLKSLEGRETFCRWSGNKYLLMPSFCCEELRTFSERKDCKLARALWPGTIDHNDTKVHDLKGRVLGFVRGPLVWILAHPHTSSVTLDEFFILHSLFCSVQGMWGEGSPFVHTGIVFALPHRTVIKIENMTKLFVN